MLLSTSNRDTAVALLRVRRGREGADGGHGHAFVVTPERGQRGDVKAAGRAHAGRAAAAVAPVPHHLHAAHGVPGHDGAVRGGGGLRELQRGTRGDALTGSAQRCHCSAQQRAAAGPFLTAGTPHRRAAQRPKLDGTARTPLASRPFAPLGGGARSTLGAVVLRPPRGATGDVVLGRPALRRGVQSALRLWRCRRSYGAQHGRSRRCPRGGPVPVPVPERGAEPQCARRG